MSPDPASSAFASFNDLRARNDELLESSESASPSLAEISDEKITTFIKRAAATGANIANARDRRKAQAIINFWTAELITRGKNSGDWSAVRLTPAESGSPRSVASEKPSVDDAELDRSRAQIRISAAARQWRVSNNDPGWLLTGDALREADEFIGDDEEIRQLVTASREAERRRTRRVRGILAGAIVLLLGLCLGLAAALVQTHRSEQLATKNALEATEARQRAERDRMAANGEANRIAELNQAQNASLAEQAQRARDQQGELDRLQDQLKRITSFVQRERKEGKIDEGDIPDDVRALVDALEPKPVSVAAAELARFSGYDPAFLQTVPSGSKSQGNQTTGIIIPLPKLTGPTLADAYNDGRPINYVNFSIVLSKARRMAIYAAANMQRSAVIPLLRANSPFHYDVRIPVSAQINPNAFASTGLDLDRGHLVNSSEIAWGPEFGTDAAAAGRLAYALVNTMTNVTPQFNTFNRGVWQQAERYAREGFNTLSDRVTIFTGPVFGDNDLSLDGNPLVAGLRVPRQFWKVLIATQPDNIANVSVEAYLISQFGQDDEKIPASVKFTPETYRVRVTDIERLTGLDFGEIVRGADIRWLTTIQEPVKALPRGTATFASVLAARLQDITSSDMSVRHSAMQAFLNGLRNPQLQGSDLRSLVEAIVALASDKSFAQLEPEARVNVLTLLDTVPREQWEVSGWIDLRSAARRAVADAATTLGDCSASPQACGVITNLKSKLGWDLAAGRTVYFQFAGMIREDAKRISDELKSLGWSIPGEERTSAAASYNEVRYGTDDDRRAAELLAADLRALGRSGVRATRSNQIKPKFLEVWISI
ncbi:DNA/RNA non-specific endonuclease [Bradyrhizobium diazoefficiens]